MKTFKTCSLSYFQISISVLLTVVTMLYVIPPGHTHFITGNWYLLAHLTHFSHPFSASENDSSIRLVSSGFL